MHFLLFSAWHDCMFRPYSVVPIAVILNTRLPELQTAHKGQTVQADIAHIALLGAEFYNTHSMESPPMKKLSNRIHILNGGREAYQNFLRNLTPQVLLLYSALVLSTKLDFKRFDLDNWQVTLAFFILLVAFGVAAWINSSNLYRSITDRLEKWQLKIGKKLDRHEITGRRRRSAARLYAVLKKKRVEFLEFMLVIFFLQTALAIVVAQAILSADTVLRVAHAG